MIPSYLSAKSMNATNGTFIGLTIITTALRFYARRFQKSPFLAADWLILPAVINLVGCAAVLIYEAHIKAVGYASSEISESVAAENLYRGAQMAIALDVMTVVSLGCVKSSACMLYRSIFCVGERNSVLNVVILTTVGLIAAWTVTFSLLSGLNCGTHMQEYMRDPSVETKYCVTFSFYYSLAITDLIFDFWVLLLPVPSILQLRATLAKKLTILGVFLLACGGVAAGTARAVIFAQIYYGGVEGLFLSDFGLKATKYQFYMILEVGIAIVAVNMPSIWMLLIKSGPQQVLGSVRSAISLASNGSKASHRPDDPEDSLRYACPSAKVPHSGGSLSYTVPFGERQAETLCTGDIRGKDVLPAPPGQVRVNKSYTQVTSSQN